MYSKQRLPNGQVRVTGGKRLTSSGAYTPAFGKQVAKLLLKQKLKAPQLLTTFCLTTGRTPNFSNS